MNRRDSVLTLLALGLAPIISSAQQPARVWHIGFLTPRSRPTSLDSDIFGAFVNGMRELGYAEGKNLVVEWRFADGRAERLPGLALELVRSRVDVIVAAGSQATSAAQKATTTIPIVMGATGDPVGSGFVKTLARPGGNITGLSNLAGDIASKHVEFLLSMVPKLSRVAVLMNPDNASHLTILKSIQGAAEKTGIKVLPLQARTSEEIEHAFVAMTRKKSGAVIVAADQYFRQQRYQISALATTRRMPSILPNRTFTEAGGLMSYGQNVADHYRRAAAFVDKILKGAKPSELPVEQSMRFELVINRKVAKILGLTIPQVLLIAADQIIE